MKKLILILRTLIFCAIFSSTALADWDWLSENMNGDTYSVDFNKIKKQNGYVYFWRLDDYVKPTETGDWSAKIYIQGDCALFRHKLLSGSFHKEPMGLGIGDTVSPKNSEWIHPSHNSANDTILKDVCEYAKKLN